ncbi:MAG: PhzF family phenazine biosynthesis protein [Acidimicrobiales bacterium]|jgi:PhzF family phenazine biosynthesis protein
MRRPFAEVDVFAGPAYSGNPVAVVLDATGLETERMQQFARWTNLSETTFLLPPADPGADYRVRIFTPARELPFAGHPTLGTCHAWLSTAEGAMSKGTVVQECPAGLVRLRQSQGRLAFAGPPLVRYGPVDEAVVGRVAEVLRVERAEIVDAHWVDNGPGWVGIVLRDAEAVLRLKPGLVDFETGVAGPYPAGSEAAFEVRAFFPQGGSTVEDPVTGSLNASLAQWFFDSGLAEAPYVVSQGTALGRRGRVHIGREEDGTIWVGGDIITCIEGTVEL